MLLSVSLMKPTWVLIKLGLNNLIYTEFEGLEEFGLAYNNELETIKGIPTQSRRLKSEDEI
ncbi:MAG: hypothetical protein IPO23_13180 [Flavobacterium sp.]|nr:hypothetical protein [Flavobacterium sp.]